MKTKISILILLFFMFCQGVVYASYFSETPSETALLIFPDNSDANWKEISRNVFKKEGLIETIPLNQTISNWSELISIQFCDKSGWDKNVVPTIESILEGIRKQTLSSYPENMATWKIIEKNKDDIIYEWVLHKPYKNISPQHEIARGFLTSTGFHRVGFTRKNGKMSLEEREKWIKLLKQHASVVSFRKAANSPGLSMVEKLKDSLSLGASFLNWKVIETFAFESGYTSVCYTPPWLIDSYVIECLECVTMPILNAGSLEQIFGAEKKCIQKKSKVQVKFDVLEQSPSEIIYSYHHPRDNLQCNVVVRSFLTDHGYYSISYKRGLPGPMEKEEIHRLKNKLKTIKIKDKKT